MEKRHTETPKGHLTWSAADVQSDIELLLQENKEMD